MFAYKSLIEKCVLGVCNMELSVSGCLYVVVDAMMVFPGSVCVCLCVFVCLYNSLIRIGTALVLNGFKFTGIYLLY